MTEQTAKKIIDLIRDNTMKFLGISMGAIVFRAYLDEFQRNAYHSHFYLGKFSIAWNLETAWLKNLQPGTVQEFVATLARAGLSNAQLCSQKLAELNQSTVNKAGEIMGNLTIPPVCLENVSLPTSITESAGSTSLNFGSSILRNFVPVSSHDLIINTGEVALALLASAVVFYSARRILFAIRN